MEEMETLGPNAHHTELNVLKKQMDELLYKEEIMWLQPSRIAWLKEAIETQIISTARQVEGQEK
jgi:hypothetical protein